jgi:integrase
MIHGSYFLHEAQVVPVATIVSQKPVAVFVKHSGMPSFSARDLRRTFKTLAGSMGIALEMRNRLQGHALVDVGSIYYDRFDYLDQKRDAMEQWAHGLTKIIGSKDEV